MSVPLRRSRIAALWLPLLAIASFVFFAPNVLGNEAALEWCWAGEQLWRQSPVLRLLILALPLLALALPDRPFERVGGGLRALGSWLLKLPSPALYLFAFALLWLFRQTDLRYGDSTFYATQLLPGEAASPRGLYLSYDEMFSSVLGSVGYRAARDWFAIDVITWHNILGLSFTASAVVWIASRIRRGGDALSGGALVVLLCGNWWQPAMGAVENYGQLLLFGAMFCWLAIESLRGREPVWKPALAYSTAAAFHLGIGWLFPALVYLIVARWRSEGSAGRWALLLCTAGPALFALSFATWLGFDIAYFFESHASQVKLLPLLERNDPYIAKNIFYDSMWEPLRLAHLGNELLLMAWPGLLALLALPPLDRDRAHLPAPVRRFGWIAACCGMSFLLLWNNELPFHLDQDLFALSGLSLTVFATVHFCERMPRLAPPDRLRLALAIAGGALCWRLGVLLQHSYLSPSYSEPWLLLTR